MNASIRIAMNGVADPLTVTSDSVRVVRPDGSAVPAVIRVIGGEVGLHLVVTPALLAEQLPELWVEVAGLPSPHSIATLDGRRLGAAVRHRITFLPAQLQPSTEPPRLLTVNGESPGSRLLEIEGELVLGFRGVLDPESITSAGCPLYPVAGSITMERPILPHVDWRCVGEQFDLILRVPPGAGRLSFSLRKLTVRDVSGRAPAPAGVSFEMLAR